MSLRNRPQGSTVPQFGQATATGAASPNLFQYTGRENDGTGLYYYRARYYHPGLQRFLSEDPIGFWGGDPNFYVYVRNSPTDLLPDFAPLRMRESGQLPG